MKSIVITLVAVLIFGCNNSKKSDSGLGIIHNQPAKKLKLLTTISFSVKSFSADSLVFNEKIIKNFDTLGQIVEMKRYIVDSTILYEHHFQKFVRDTLLKIEKRIGDVYKPKLEIDTLKYFNGLLIEKKTTTGYRYSSNNGEDKGTPIHVKTSYKYDKKKRLISTSELSDGIINYCTYSYNENNQLVLKTCKNSDLSKKYLYTEKLYYNEKGLKIKQTETTFRNGSTIDEYKRFYNYNMHDSLIYQSWYRNGNNFLIYNYKFNNKGQKIAEYCLNDNSGDSTVISMKTFYYHDKKDNLKMISVVAKNGELKVKKIFSYDNNNNKIEETKISNYIDSDNRAVQNKIVTKYYYEYY